MQVAGLLAVWRVVQIVQAVRTRGWEDYDFNHYYVSSRLLAGGQNPYRVPLEELSRAMGFVVPVGITTATNPPPLLWTLAPLSLLPPQLAFVLWVLVEILSLVTLLYLTCQLLGRRLTTRGRWFVVALSVGSAPVCANFVFSHVELLIAATVLIAYRWHVEGRPLPACLTLLAGGLLKLYPLALLPWFLWRGPNRWQDRVRWPP